MSARSGLLVLMIMACNPLVAACGPRSEPDIPADPALAVAAADSGCASDSVRPASAAPAEGLWGYEDPAGSHRVAAMIGPASSAAGTPRVTRTVETLETGADRDAIRHSSDTVSLHLELVPPFDRPAAVYAVAPSVLLVSYEPCAPDLREPLIRYLREDAGGGVVTDVLLRRRAQP